VYALDAKKGTLLWKTQLRGQIQSSTPAVVDGVVYISATDNYVYALDATHNGQVLWKYNAKYEVRSSPAVLGGTVYIAAQGMFYAIDAKTGKRIWYYDFGGLGITYSSPAIAYGLIYVWEMAGSAVGTLLALTPNGDKSWSYDSAWFASTPTVANGVVYLEAADGCLIALSADKGNLLGSPYKIEGGVSSPASVSNGFVYIGSGFGTLYVFH
jgi:outer membrane protein assembly factor BamB